MIDLLVIVLISEFVRQWNSFECVSRSALDAISFGSVYCVGAWVSGCVRECPRECESDITWLHE